MTSSYYRVLRVIVLVVVAILVARIALYLLGALVSTGAHTHG
jgi:hypothetical protein